VIGRGLGVMFGGHGELGVGARVFDSLVGLTYDVSFEVSVERVYRSRPRVRGGGVKEWGSGFRIQG